MRTRIIALLALVVLAIGCRDEPGERSAPTTASLSSTTDPSTSTIMPPKLDLLAAAGLPPLTEDYPCGYGFTIGAADETAALLIAGDVATARSGPPLDGVLTGPAWAAEVRIGERLFANWCDDVRMWPYPVI